MNKPNENPSESMIRGWNAVRGMGAASSESPPNEITELWPDDLKQALACVVSLVRQHAGARYSAAWSELWAHFEKIEAELATEKEAHKKTAEQLVDMKAYADYLELKYERPQ